MSIEINNLSSGYRRIPVIKHINAQLYPGEVVSLIGLNGAGKSTLLKTILGLIQPLEGEVLLNGISLLDDQMSYAGSIGYIPETPILYEELTLREHLEMVALGYQLPLGLIMERAQPMLEKFRLADKLDWFPTHFSKGMKQKVMIICAFVTDATIFIIDEPFLGLDPVGIQDLMNLMRQRAKAGATILFTTHVLSMADQLADRYLLMRSGEIVADGNLSQLQEQFKLPGATMDEIYLKLAEVN
ncbi:multidrug ABC transporter ATP-binding protein [Falseniella ignava]|uniref:Multidrug ABC transporter ATP-binding protein n=1 Tax=Falseniella ignava TaxID=137730 RepID=A0A2I1K551_9LACT|nr:ABC transporter ATP-binding protein [Falseniella ignava]PKY90768.1 multidrug ABC transporter ATP-binding protein [Falseniella ignava]